MRFAVPLAAVLLATLATSADADAAPKRARSRRPGVARKARAEAAGPKAWCAPEVKELSDHTCYAEGSPGPEGRKTLVIYLHGVYAATPGFAWLQQRAMALHAKRHGFTVLLPTAPRTSWGYGWPTSQAAQKEHEATVLAGIERSRSDLEARLGRKFDETFVVGFSSGAYYASSLAVRGALDVDGYIVLAGGSSWARGEPTRRAPVFVGVSTRDRQTVAHSRGFANTLAALKWPFRVEERPAGHEVDWTFMAHGISWLRAKKGPPAQAHRPS